jgi:hypothetical protein
MVQSGPDLTTLILIPVPATRELSCVPSTIHLVGVIVNQIRSYKILFKDAWYVLLNITMILIWGYGYVV